MEKFNNFLVNYYYLNYYKYNFLDDFIKFYGEFS